MLAISLLDMRTPVLRHLGNNLIKEGYDVCYFSNEKQNLINIQEPNFLIDGSGVCSVDSNHINRFQTLYENDRSIKYYYKKYDALRLFEYWYKLSVDFISQHNVTAALIEGTPAHELVFEMACKDMSVRILNVFHAPGPRGWSLISDSSIEQNLFKNKQFSTTYLTDVYSAQQQRKTYVDFNEKPFTKLKRFLKRPINFNYYPKYMILGSFVSRPISILLSYLLILFKGSQKHSVFYLHMEPERTVSNCGSPFMNQIAAIEYITKKLKHNITLKEHPDWVGKRDIKFLFYALLNKRVTYVISLKREVKLAWTFSGSIAWENELKLKPTILLGNTYLRCAPSTYAIFSKSNDYEKVNDFFKHIADHVFQCELSGVNLTPEVISKENVHRLTNAVVNCLTS